MNFFSLTFIAFLGAVILLLSLLNSKVSVKVLGESAAARVSNILLIIGSLFFIGYVDFRACLIVLGSGLFAHIIACAPVRNRFGAKARILGVACSLGLLGVFKYFDFFVSSFCSCFGFEEAGALVLYIPLGVSYFTFSIISYICDMYSGKISGRVSLADTMLYVVFFPKFVSGPIVRAVDFMDQVRKRRSITLLNLEKGIQIFLLGMFKKVVIADHLSVFVNDVFDTPAAYDSFTVWLAVISYTLQLYFDFSGYSDMAIGCSAMLGFDFKRNFNMPFAACSIQDFWRRWHISLSTWFREYLYIPLGGNRKGKLRTGVNKSIVFLLTGLWHGANWTFVCWGLMHGVFMLLETYKVIQPNKWKIKPLKYIYTLSVVVLAFMIFRADSLSKVTELLEGMFSFRNGICQPFTWTFVAVALLVVSIIVIWRKNSGAATGERMAAFYPCVKMNRFSGLLVVWLVVFAILAFAYMGSTGFIYAQF